MPTKVTIELTYEPQYHIWQARAYDGRFVGLSGNCITKWGARREALRTLKRVRFHSGKQVYIEMIVIND